MLPDTPVVVSVREEPSCVREAIAYTQASWPEILPIMYEDCISHCIGAKKPLPQWYILRKGPKTIGCAGLITNDFISRGDLYPWLCALHVSQDERGHAYSTLLIDKAKQDAARFGFDELYLVSELVGFYEKYGFRFLARGYHPWDEEASIYVAPTGG